MYTNLVNSALLMSGFALHSVNAGSWAWQPKVNTSFASIENTEPLSGTVKGIKTETELHSLDKRYSYTVNTDAKPWPGCTIRYCFADDDTEQALFDNLKDAIERWYRSGLDRNSFKWEKVSRDECAQKRSTHLVISTTQVKSHDTTVGFEPAGPGFPGPSMNLYDGDLKALDKVASFSHEVGHAWGLRHEHQVPQYWKTGEGFADAVGGASAVFGNGNFHCENLADYEEKTAFVRDTMGQPPNIVKQLCTKYSIARQYKFSAVNWLPDTSGIVATDSDQGVDWDSIMLYPGFVGSGDPNVQILTKPDGSSITQNINPSERDVRGLNKFCENAGPPPPPLLVAKSNPKRSRFRDLFKKDNGPKGGC